MNPISYKKTLMALVTVALVTRTVYRFLARRKKKQLVSKHINEVIIFSEATDLIPSKFTYLSVNVPASVDRLLYYLDQAKYSLDICMHVLTSRDISFMIQRLHSRGVKIRYIADGNTAFESNAETKRLLKQRAIALRWIKTDNIMHHKFCIIDAITDAKEKEVVPFLMTGSLNWTNQGLNGNWETVVVMSEPRIVQIYKDEFERLWLQFGTPQHSWKNVT